MTKDPFKEFKPAKKVRTQLRKVSHVAELIEAGKTGQELFGFSDYAIQCFSAAARNLLEESRFHEASDAFIFLVSMVPHDPSFWMGLGASLQSEHLYEQAINAYEMAAIYDLENPWPYFYLAKCLFAIHDRVSALQALELTIDYCGDDREHIELKLEALKAKAVLGHAD